MNNYKIAMATFRTSQCQDGVKSLKRQKPRLRVEFELSAMIIIGNQMVYSGTSI